MTRKFMSVGRQKYRLVKSISMEEMEEFKLHRMAHTYHFKPCGFNKKRIDLFVTTLDSKRD